MPEGHTLHRLAREMAELAGQTVVAASPQGRFDAAAVNGSKVESVDAFGKHLLVDMSTGLSVHVHLGMKGKWLRFSPVTGDAMKQVRLRLATPTVAWNLIAPSKCDLFDASDRSALIDKLGPDPLRADADVNEAQRRLTAFNGPVAVALLDQRVIAGVGNVFRAEALHACGIAPDRPAANVTAEEFERLWKVLMAMMSTAVDDGRIITIDADDRLALPEDESRHVYKRQHCFDCGTAVVSKEMDGRTSYSCPSCQAA